MDTENNVGKGQQLERNEGHVIDPPFYELMAEVNRGAGGVANWLLSLLAALRVSPFHIRYCTVRYRTVAQVRIMKRNDGGKVIY